LNFQKQILFFPFFFFFCVFSSFNHFLCFRSLSSNSLTAIPNFLNCSKLASLFHHFISTFLIILWIRAFTRNKITALPNLKSCSSLSYLFWFNFIFNIVFTFKKRNGGSNSISSIEDYVTKLKSLTFLYFSFIFHVFLFFQFCQHFSGFWNLISLLLYQISLLIQRLKICILNLFPHFNKDFSLIGKLETINWLPSLILFHI